MGRIVYLNKYSSSDKLILDNIPLGHKTFELPDFDEKYIHFTFEERLNEVYDCLDARLLSAALTLALTLPDICGFADSYRDSRVGKRYIEWCDKYVAPTYGENADRDVFHGDYGKTVYALRCSFLHAGDIVGHDYLKETDKQGQLKDLKDGELRRRFSFGSYPRQDEKAHGTFIESFARMDEYEIFRFRVESLCMHLLCAATEYFNKHRKKFTFLRTYHSGTIQLIDFDIGFIPYDMYGKDRILNEMKNYLAAQHLDVRLHEIKITETDNDQVFGIDCDGISVLDMIGVCNMLLEHGCCRVAGLSAKGQKKLSEFFSMQAEAGTRDSD